MNTSEEDLDGEPLIVTTESGFGIKTALLDAFDLYSGHVGVEFTDEHSSTIIGQDNGIIVEKPDHGFARIKTTGLVIGRTGYGISVGATSTGVTIEAATVTGGSGGILGVADWGSDAKITTSGIVTGNNGHGIEGSSQSGALSITATAKVVGIGTGHDGINASIGEGASDLTIKTAAVTGTRYGIFADHAGSGLVDITTSGAVTGDDIGIRVSRTGITSHATINANAAITGAGGIAIDLEGDGHDVVNLGPGAVINGSIDFGDGADPVNGNHTNSNDMDTLNALPGWSGTVTFKDNNHGDSDLQSSPEDWSDNIVMVNNAAVVSAPTAVIIDPSGFAASGLFLRSLPGAIFNSIDNSGSMATKWASASSFASTHGLGRRHLTSGFDSREQQITATTGSGAGFTAMGASESTLNDSGPLYWAAGFGGYQEVDAWNNHVDLEHDFAGGMAGAEFGLNGDMFGLFGGIGKSDVDIDFDAGSTDVESIFVGAYWKRDFDSYSIHLALLGGSADHEFRRNIAGTTPTTARGSADGWFISPSATFFAPIKAMPISTIGSVRVSYAGMFLDGYTETGVNLPLKVSGRDLHLLSTRAQLAFPMSYSLEGGSHGNFEIRTGLDGHFDIGSDKVTGSVSGVPMRFSAGLNDEVSAFLGFRLTNISSDGDLSLSVSGEVQSTFSGGYEVLGEARVMMQF
ncbi:MAG: autotransporter domain-containing protein [Gammaproteobacteria bacterium]|nr:autotransporter domain-containing protein [Gammaproteobacteria bacterium]